MKDVDQPFLAHFSELRLRLIQSFWALAILFPLVYLYYDGFVDFLMAPFLTLAKSSAAEPLFVNSVLEGFVTRIKVSLLLALLFSSPFHIFQVVRFVFPALYPKEKQIIGLILLGSAGLLIGSVYYSYYQIIPISIDFLLSAGFIPEDVGVLLNFERNVMFVFQFIVAGLLLFQLPMALLVLLLLRAVERKTVIKAFRYIVVGVFLLAALITPPDPVSLLAIALPLVALFGLVILIAVIFRLG